MKKTIIDVQELAQRYLEDEALMFEIHLLNIKEELINESETVRNITGYLESLYDDFEICDYSIIHEDIEKYIDIKDIERNSTYFKLLEKKFADARITSLNVMLGLCGGKSFKYDINTENLNTSIGNFNLSNKIQRLIDLSGHAKPETKHIQEAIYELASEIKTKYKDQNKKLLKKTLAIEIFNIIDNKQYENKLVMSANLTVENIERKYLKGWKDI